MIIKKYIIKKILQKWVTNVADNNIQGVMKKANLLLWEDGRCQVGFTLEKEHTNAQGILHSGMAILLADVTCALAVFSHPKVLTEMSYPVPPLAVPSTVNLGFSFLDTSIIGDEVLVDANTRSIKVCIRSGEAKDIQTINGPLASLDVSILNNSSNSVVVKGNMLMHVGGLAKG